MATLGIRDLLLALAITAVWGLNFVVIRLGVDTVPPLVLSAMRFLLAAFPLVFFVPRPKVSIRTFLGISIMLGIFSFAFLFIGISAGLSAGMASLVLQSQVFFTAVLAVGFFGESLSRRQLAGIIVAVFGIVLIAISTKGTGTLVGFLLVIAAAFFWAISNLFMKQASQVDMLSLMVWTSIVPPVPLLALSFMMDGSQVTMDALYQLDITRIGAVLYLAYVATIFGFGGWAMLIARHGAGRIAPFSLLVPVFGMASSSIFLGETFGPTRIFAALMILCGLALTIWKPADRGI